MPSGDQTEVIEPLGGLVRTFHEGRTSGFASHLHTSLLAALGPRCSFSYTFGPRLPAASFAGGWLCRARVQPVPWETGCFFKTTR